MGLFSTLLKIKKKVISYSNSKCVSGEFIRKNQNKEVSITAFEQTLKNKTLKHFQIFPVLWRQCKQG